MFCTDKSDQVGYEVITTEPKVMGEKVTEVMEVTEGAEVTEVRWRWLTLINILLPTALEDLAGEQYTDMDFLSRENSSVNSFFIRCLIT